MVDIKDQTEVNSVELQSRPAKRPCYTQAQQNGSPSGPLPAKWDVRPSKKAQRVINPIRRVVDGISRPKECTKELIPLSLGDPTVFGNLSCPAELTESIVRHARAGTSNGYCHSAGTPAARQAIAATYSLEGCRLSAEDVYIASGCSGALDLVMSALLDEGDNVLVPRPGFPLYQVVADSIGAECRHYALLPERHWEADLASMRSLIDGRTRAILVNNPSNPCGSVYSEAHLKDIVALAEAYRLPLIADEIYGSMAFDDCDDEANGIPQGSANGAKQHCKRSFIPLAALSGEVPVITTGGLAKQFMVPGWRVGWVMVYDRQQVMGEIRQGLTNLSQLVLGANSLIQAAIPDVLTPAAGSAEQASLKAFHANYMRLLKTNAAYTVDRLSRVPGLSVVVPQGAMYVMVKVDVALMPAIEDDRDFAQRLLQEEAVFVLPGQCFGIENYFRIVFTAPQEKLAEAYNRMEEFCRRHCQLPN